MEKITEKRKVNFLTFLFSLTYMTSYITRINFGAVIVAMEGDTGLGTSASLLSLAVTGSFITYGLGQVVSGIIGDRISPKRLVTYGFILTVAMNFMIPFCKSPYLMTGVWCVNGFAQSLIWPPLVRLVATLFTANDYKSAISKASWGGNFGTVLVYLLAPVLVSFFGWRSVFWSSAFCGIIIIFIWNKYCYDIGVQKREKTVVEVSNDKKYKLFTPLMIAIMIAIVLQGMLRDGIATWMPSYIKESYDLGDAASILTGVVLPIFSIFCVQLATKIYIKKFTNPIACATLFFAIGAVSAVGVYILSGVEVISSIVLFAILSGSMHGVNVMLVCMIPQFFEKSGRVSTISGVINSFTYLGSAISTYGIAYLAEIKGWGANLISWILIALFGTMLCAISIKRFKSRFEI